MPAHMSDNQVISVLHRMIHLVTWILVAAAHTALLTIALFAAYLLDLKAKDIYNMVSSLGNSLGLQAGWQALSFFGVSGFAVLSGYAILVKKYAVKFSIYYLFKNIYEQKIK
jgi:hypothetical protein